MPLANCSRPRELRSTPSAWYRRRLEDVFLDVVERVGAAQMHKVVAVGTKELRQILRDKRTLLILLFIPAFFCCRTATP